MPKKVAVVIRPETARLVESEKQLVKNENVLVGKVDIAMFLGDRIEARLRVGKAGIIIYLPNTLHITPGMDLKFVIPRNNTIVVPAAGEKAYTD